MIYIYILYIYILNIYIYKLRDIKHVDSVSPDTERLVVLHLTSIHTASGSYRQHRMNFDCEKVCISEGCFLIQTFWYAVASPRLA